MLLYVLRHGIAQDRAAPDGPPDPQRDLTPRGVRRTRSALAGLRALGVEVSEIWTSPYVRALRTAELAAETFGLGAPRIEPALAPGRSVAAAFALVAARPAPAVLVCGHAPDLDRLIGHALLGEEVLVTSLKKAGCACLALEAPPAPGGVLRWVHEPAALRRLGGDPS